MPIVQPKPFEIDATNHQGLLKAFGDRGLDLNTEFESRTERHRANHGLEEELFLLRRYLLTLSRLGRLAYPLKLAAQESPDFLLVTNGVTVGIEVTEATSWLDQREFTLEEDEAPSLIGAYGGRYSDGAVGDQPERDLTADTLKAVRRKVTKIRKGGYEPTPTLELLIYANSNASLLSNEQRAIEMLKPFLSEARRQLFAGTNITRVALIVRNHIALFDERGVEVFAIAADGDAAA
jgi:hypothetical protein